MRIIYPFDYEHKHGIFIAPKLAGTEFIGDAK